MSGRLQGDLPDRTFQFALAVIAIVDQLPDGTKGWVLGKQLLRSGTSVGANIQEANHALSDAEFIQRCSIARKEASETIYWMRLCSEIAVVDSEAVEALLREANELVSILATIVKKSQRFRSAFQ